MFSEDENVRHERSRQFAGRVAELQFAEYLETQGWTASGLEALRKGPDIEALARDGRPVAFEVKFIGIEKDDFAEIVKSLAGDPAGGSTSPYDACDYLLFRVYEAAKQLERVTCDRVAVVVMDDLTFCCRFDVELKDRWINWAHPRFYLKHDFIKFAAYQKQNKYHNLEDNLQPALQSLKAVWIFRRSGDYTFHREFEIPFDRV
jgi:hypothetical protein